jgi:hypothetical protein
MEIRYKSLKLFRSTPPNPIFEEIVQGLAAVLNKVLEPSTGTVVPIPGTTTALLR